MIVRQGMFYLPAINKGEQTSIIVYIRGQSPCENDNWLFYREKKKNIETSTIIALVLNELFKDCPEPYKTAR